MAILVRSETVSVVDVVGSPERVVVVATVVVFSSWATLGPVAVAAAVVYLVVCLQIWLLLAPLD